MAAAGAFCATTSNPYKTIIPAACTCSGFLGLVILANEIGPHKSFERVHAVAEAHELLRVVAVHVPCTLAALGRISLSLLLFTPRSSSSCERSSIGRQQRRPGQWRRRWRGRRRRQQRRRRRRTRRRLQRGTAP